MNSNKKKQITGIVLAIFMLVALLNSAYFFLALLKLSIGQWLAFNACSVAIIIYLICFIISAVKRNSIWLSVALLPMYYYGTMGLFIMPWNVSNLFAHITHIIITCNALWVLFLIFKEQKFAALGKAFLFSILVFVPLFAVIQTYNQVHFEEFMRILRSM